MFVEIDTERAKIGNGQRHPLFIHKKKKASSEELSKDICQLFKYALYKRLHLSFTIILKWMMTESVNIIRCIGWLLSLFKS